MRIALLLLFLVSLCWSAGNQRMDSLTTRALKTTTFSATNLTADSIATRAIRVSGYMNIQRGPDRAQAGDVWNDSAHRMLGFYTSGMEHIVTGSIFDQSNVVLDSNSTSEVVLKGDDSTDIGLAIKDSLPANFFRKWKNIRYFSSGLYSTTTPPKTVLLRLKMNATVLCSVSVALDASETNKYWSLQGNLRCDSAGTTGRVVTSTSWRHDIALGGDVVTHGATMRTPAGGKTINTTIAQRFYLTAQFESAYAGAPTMIKCEEFTVEDVH